MKMKLILPMFLLLGIVGCGNNTTTSSSTSSENLNVITDVPEADKVTPTQSNSFEFDDLNDSKAKYDTNKWYVNDLVHINLPDPYVIEVDGTYYIYGTTDRTAARTVDCYSTTDFNNFKPHLDVFKRDNSYWSGTNTGIFAPEVMEFDGMYYMYYSADHKESGRRYIDVVVSDSPTGPFVGYEGIDANGNEFNTRLDPIFRHNDSIGLSVLDQTMFIDDDGKMYMYYSVYDTNRSQYIVGFEMEDPVTPNWDTYKILVRPGEETTKETYNYSKYFWEAYTGFEVAEGPQMIKSPNGKYYLTYSVNHYPNKYYTVCYAVSDSPLGDYTKPWVKDQSWTNLLFGYAGGMQGSSVYQKWDGFMSGTAHHCFFKIGDQYMIGYHAHQNRKGDSARYFAMDKLFFDKDGVPFCQGPSATIQTLPEAISGYKNIAVDAKIYASETIRNAERLTDNYISEHYNLVQEQDTETYLPDSKCYIELEFDKEYEIGGIQIVNSCTFGKHVEEVEFINFFNGNAIIDGCIDYDVVNIDTEFIFPDSGLTYNLYDIKADKVVICFDNTWEAQINEIIVLGK